MEHLKLPITDPILVFMLVLFIILMVPVLLRKTNIPSIVGLIIIGLIIGPYGFKLINNNDTIVLFSKVGLLYIMFLAALELEFVEFRKNSVQASSFGFLTFFFPLVLGFLAAKMILNLELIPSVLVGIMLSSNTLIAYPIASKLGVNKSPAAITAISGTVIADTIVLIALAFFTAYISKDEGSSLLLRFIISFSIFVFFVFILLPIMSKWFFKTIANDGNLQLLFALVALFLSAFAAELAGAEPIIGAFFAGLSLNRLIPSSSALMNRIDFVGNTLFIPFFLISVGMMVNLNVLLDGYLPLIYAIVLLFFAILGKWMAAYFVKLFFKISSAETQFIFGLTTARAAASLAIALIGLHYGVLSENLFNATILLILFSSILSSYITEKAALRMISDDNSKLITFNEESKNRFLVPIANPLNISKLIDLAIILHSPNDDNPIFPLTIVHDDEESRVNILSSKPVMDKIINQSTAANINVQGITRIDLNIPSAIARASKELNISDVIIGWSGRTSKEISKLFGNFLESVLDNCSTNIIVSHLVAPLNLTNKIIVYIPKNAEKEVGFSHWLELLGLLSKQLTASFQIFLPVEASLQIEKYIKSALKGHKLIFDKYESLPVWNSEVSISKDILYIFINARRHTLSYDQQFYKLTYRMPKQLKDSNVLNFYPPQ